MFSWIERCILKSDFAVDSEGDEVRAQAREELRLVGALVEAVREMRRINTYESRRDVFAAHAALEKFASTAARTAARPAEQGSAGRGKEGGRP